LRGKIRLPGELGLVVQRILWAHEMYTEAAKLESLASWRLKAHQGHIENAKLTKCLQELQEKGADVISLLASEGYQEACASGRSPARTS